MATRQLPAPMATPPRDGVRHQDLVHAGSWMVGSFVLFSLANYALSLALSRVLSIPDYGSFGILSCVLLLEALVATAGFPWMLSTTVARYSEPRFKARRASALSTALAGNLMLGVVSALVIFVLMRHLVPGHPFTSVLAATAGFFICANAVWLGLFQGERRFSLLAGLRVVDSLTKLLLGLALATVGFGVDGAAGGIVAGAAVIAIWGAARSHESWMSLTALDRTVLQTVVWAAAAQLGFGLLMNMDILAVRAFGVGSGGTTGAGYYQAALVLARSPVYVGVALLSAVFPFLAAATGDRALETRLLRTVLRVMALVPVPAAVLLIAAPGAAIHVFFPPAYAPAAPLLRINAAAGICLIALDVAIIAHQATRSMRPVALALLPAVLAEGIALWYAVPRYGAEGAAWSLWMATVAGAVFVWIPTARQWSPRSVSPSPRLAIALLGFGFTAFLFQVRGWQWLPEAAVLWLLFLLSIWLLRSISAAELEPLAPPPARRFLRWVADHERGGR